MKITLLTFLILFFFSCGIKCPDNFTESDSIAIGADWQIYAGREDQCPVVFKMKNEDCSTIEYIIAPTGLKNEAYIYDKFISQGERITIQYFHRSEGDNSSIGFIISTDNGNSWESVFVDAIDSEADGIRAIELKDESTIIIKLYKLDLPNQYISRDNGQSWSPIN